MTASDPDYDDILRRALHAAAESVEPSGDGLERIRERLARPPLLSFSSIAAWYSVVAVRLTGWAGPAFGTAAEIFRAAVDRFRPPHARPGHAKPRFGWLRPASATALAIFVVVGGAFAAMAIPRAISGSLSSATGQSSHGNGPVASSGRTVASGSSRVSGSSGSASYAGGRASSPSAAISCHPVSGSPSASITPTPGSTSSSAPPTSSSPPASSTSPAPSGSTTPSPSVSDTSPSEPGSGTTVTPGSAAESSAPASASPGTGSASTGSAGTGSSSPSAPSMRPAQRHRIARRLGASPTLNPCPSVSPSFSPSVSPSAAQPRALGPGEPALVIRLTGAGRRLHLFAGRASE